MSESRVKVCLRIRPLVGKERGQRVTFSDCGDKRYVFTQQLTHNYMSLLSACLSGCLQQQTKLTYSSSHQITITNYNVNK